MNLRVIIHSAAALHCTSAVCVPVVGWRDGESGQWGLLGWISGLWPLIWCSTAAPVMWRNMNHTSTPGLITYTGPNPKAHWCAAAYRAACEGWKPNCKSLPARKQAHVVGRQRQMSLWGCCRLQHPVLHSLPLCWFTLELCQCPSCTHGSSRSPASLFIPVEFISRMSLWYL